MNSGVLGSAGTPHRQVLAVEELLAQVQGSLCPKPRFLQMELWGSSKGVCGDTRQV